MQSSYKAPSKGRVGSLLHPNLLNETHWPPGPGPRGPGGTEAPLKRIERSPQHPGFRLDIVRALSPVPPNPSHQAELFPGPRLDPNTSFAFLAAPHLRAGADPLRAGQRRWLKPPPRCHPASSETQPAPASQPHGGGRIALGVRRLQRDTHPAPRSSRPRGGMGGPRRREWPPKFPGEC